MATAAPHTVDPLLRRGVRLLFSRAPDSLESLKSLVEEARTRGAPGAKMPEEQAPAPAKRPRLAPPDPAPLAPPSPPRAEGKTARRSSDSDQELQDFNDIAMEITSGIRCTVCKLIDFYSGNQLVECQECHLIYHQVCHKPSISQADITDPRRVWYCAKCARNMRKQTAAPTAVSGSTRSSTSRHPAPARLHASSPSKPAPAAPPPASPSKGAPPRLTPFANLSSVSTRSGVGTERTALGRSDAAKASAHRDGAAKTGAAAPPTAAGNTLLSAERRVAMMKKRARVAQERRKL